MSSTTGLSRTRSLRQPATSRDQSSQKEAPASKDESGSASPSRLPQIKPLTRSGATTGTTSASAAARSRAASNVTNTTTASGRPLSGIFSSKAAATAAASTTRRTSPINPENVLSRPLGRAPSIRQVPSTQQTSTTSTAGSRRSPSASIPRSTSPGGSSSSSAPKPRPLGHARAKSTATTLTAATTLRPPASSGPPSFSNPPATPNSATASGRPTRTHGRTLSQSAATGTTQPAAIPPAHRPAFNTNQQHYSPLKSHAPKPLTATYLAPPSPSKLPSNVAISAETLRLQTELLQLSLIHREAGSITREWHKSAKQKLGKRFADVARGSGAVHQEERAGIEERNIAALVRWGKNDNGKQDLEGKVQSLDQVLDGVWSFSEPGGRYDRVVKGFEDWAGPMAAIVAMQNSGKGYELVQGSDVLFVSDLDARWKADCAGLNRKLEAWREMLQDIGTAPRDGDEKQGSSLSRVLEGCTSLIGDMLAELDIMQEVERDARRAEDEWIEMMNEELNISDNEAMDREAPLWKMII